MKGPVLYFGVLAILLVAVACYFLPESGRDTLRQWSMETLSPIFRGVGWLRERQEQVADRLKTSDEVLAELRQLRETLARVEAENSLLRGHQEENMRLREMLGFKQQTPYRLLASKVIERDPSNWWNAVIINRGYEDDPALAPDQPVVSPRGVVGKTGTVGRFTTRVILLVDENCKISAVSESSRSRGIVQGATSINGGQPVCRFTFIERESELAVGERVFTTGLGGTFPANLLIGIVSEAPPLSADRNFGLYREGTVEPTVDLNDLREVFVILGLKN
jgi:rod shape-determining protein MreC